MIPRLIGTDDQIAALQSRTVNDDPGLFAFQIQRTGISRHCTGGKDGFIISKFQLGNLKRIAEFTLIDFKISPDQRENQFPGAGVLIKDGFAGIFGFDMKNQSELKGTRHDLFALAQQLHDEGGLFPHIYLWCGEQDRGHEYSERFSALLKELGVPHRYDSSEGDHSWPWWDRYIQDAMYYLTEQMPPMAQ